MTREELAYQEANELILFCHALEDTGTMPEYVARARTVARELEWALGALADERAARIHDQAALERCQQLLANKASDACDTDDLDIAL